LLLLLNFFILGYIVTQFTYMWFLYCHHIIYTTQMRLSYFNTILYFLIFLDKWLLNISCVSSNKFRIFWLLAFLFFFYKGKALLQIIYFFPHILLYILFELLVNFHLKLLTSWLIFCSVFFACLLLLIQYLHRIV
jgi:hypothetical protein